MLSEQAKNRLLKIARASVEAAAGGKRQPQFIEPYAELQGNHGCFVTLKNKGSLRGCIGCFSSDKPLWRTVQEQAVASTKHDPRFLSAPITPEEVPQLTVEISVLSPLRRIENPLDLDLGKHGIVVQRGSRRGCFLPQVATETGWSKEEFLSRCCEGKAGLDPGAWRDPSTEVLVFTAEVFHEQAENG